MNEFATIFLLINVILLLVLPQRWAPLPLLIGACFMTKEAVLVVGPFNFMIVRAIVAAGLLRVMLRGERLADGMNELDRLMLLWSAWALLSSLFHADPEAALINRLGLVYDACGIYFLVRVFCQSFEDVEALARALTVLLVPLAAAMLYEKVTQVNIFSALVDGSFSPVIRDERIRAQGPFAHAILAGTAGAVCIPLFLPLWRQHRTEALAGIGACLAIIFASTSSGPILTALAGAGALFLWRHRGSIRTLQWAAVAGYLVLEVVMTDPAYFILARVDLTGSSTGWHRARLIQSAFEHLSEWWMIGTDYTRHWMPTGVYWSEAHTDITSHYLQMGVLGGLPLMALFIVVLAKAFSLLKRSLRAAPDPRSGFLLWSLGAALFAHAATFISVSYFDQSVVFLYLTLAAIGSSRAAVAAACTPAFPGTGPRPAVLRPCTGIKAGVA